MAKAKKTEEPIDFSQPLANSKYERFCQEYMKDNNGTQATIRAGYSEKTAGSKAVSLLQIVAIKNRLAVLRDKLANETGISVKMVADGFKKIATGMLSKQLTNKNKLRALENLGKHLGFYERNNKQIAEGMASLLNSLDGRTRGLPSQ